MTFTPVQPCTLNVFRKMGMISVRYTLGILCFVLVSQGKGSNGEEIDEGRWMRRTAAAPEATPYFTSWDAIAPDRGPLGLQLSDKLIVLGFVSDKRGFASVLHTQGGVLVGDEVVAVNGEVGMTRTSHQFDVAHQI